MDKSYWINKGRDMSGINKVIILGRLVKEPNVMQLDNGTWVSRFHLSTINKWLDKATGAMNQHEEWHKIILYGRLAEVSRNIFKVNDSIYVDGYLRTHHFTDTQGSDRYVTEVVGMSFEIMHVIKHAVEEESI